MAVKKRDKLLGQLLGHEQLRPHLEATGQLAHMFDG